MINLWWVYMLCSHAHLHRRKSKNVINGYSWATKDMNLINFCMHVSSELFMLGMHYSWRSLAFVLRQSDGEDVENWNPCGLSCETLKPGGFCDLKIHYISKSTVSKTLKTVWHCGIQKHWKKQGLREMHTHVHSHVTPQPRIRSNPSVSWQTDGSKKYA